MGFLEIGQPLTWIETELVKEKIKKDGLSQLLHIFHLNRFRNDRDLKWGEELEFTLIHFDHANQEAKVCIDGPQILAQLEEREKLGTWDPKTWQGPGRPTTLHGAVWHPEFGRHMIEATPNPPYDLSVESLLEIEPSMASRRLKLQSVLDPDVYASSITAFPRLGLTDFMWSREDLQRSPRLDPERNQSCGMSVFIPDAMICPHPRFPTLVRNVTTRRKCKSVMLTPVFADSHTASSPAWAKSLEDNGTLRRRAIAARSATTENPVKQKIFMDHFGFGMGMSCLQMTFGAPSLPAARFLYDQMAVLAPIFLALSAATPCLRGFLSDYDARWQVLEQGCDDRQEQEVLEEREPGDEGRPLRRTRYGPVSLYVASDSEYLVRHEQYLNDVEVPKYEPGFQQLTEGGMDRLLADHFASLWVRDPLVVFGDKLHLSTTTAADHFENIQSTNWNSVRFKPPPPSSDGQTLPGTGWRVELRTCDLQLTDFENAALSALSNLLAMAILQNQWTFYIPISQTHENMDTAHLRDAVRQALFWFPTRIATSADDEVASSSCSDSHSSVEEPPIRSAQMTLREIFLGSRREGLFEGLIPMLDKFVSGEWRSGRCSRAAVERYRIYASFIRLRVLGQAPSNAAVLRNFVRSHPDYEADSIVSSRINYDLCKLAVMTGLDMSEKFPGPPRTVKSTLANIPVFRSFLSTKGETESDAVTLSLHRMRSASSSAHQSSEHWEPRCLDPPAKAVAAAEDV